MATKNEIEVELQKIAKAKPKSGEDQSAYIERLVEVVQEKVEKDEDLWETLSTTAQNFVNDVTNAANDKKDIPDFPANATEEEEAGDDEETEDDAGEDEEEGEEDEASDDEETEDDEPEKEAKKVTTKKKATEKKAPAKKAAPEKEKAPAKKAAEKKAPEKKPAKEKAPPAEKKKVAVKTRSGAQQVIKKLILKSPTITVEQLMEKLEKAGHKPSRLAVSSIRSGFRDSIRVIKDAGYLEDVEL